MTRVGITFRGEECVVVIDKDTGYDDETNAREIEWHFDGLTPEQHNALAVTDEEEQAIFNECADARDEESW